MGTTRNACPQPNLPFVSLLLGGEVGLESRRAVVLAAAAGARVYSYCQFTLHMLKTLLRLNIPCARFPQAHVLLGSLFSVAALSQAVGSSQYNYVISMQPSGSQDKNLLHWRAGCLPQEQVASFAHTHSAPLLRPQQVMMMVLVLIWRYRTNSWWTKGSRLKM